MQTLTADTFLRNKFTSVRETTEKLCQPLAKEDFVVQPVEEVSPPKWHLAHTTWFFEIFILKKFLKDYQEFHPQYNYLFNSYYMSVGERAERSGRGFLTRPTVEEVISYRAYVNEHIYKLIDQEPESAVFKLLELGLNHEQQHQELLLYDLKFILGHNPVFPNYLPINKEPVPVYHSDEMLSIEEGMYEIGYEGPEFHWDNEEKIHKVFLHPYKIMDRLVTNEEFVEFIEDGGYKRFDLWFMEAFEWVEENRIKAPLYWHKLDGIWHRYSLRGGLKPVDPKAPVTHVSMYEADAYARWKGKRLPTEFEWEVAAKQYGSMDGANLMHTENYEPSALRWGNKQFFGDVWEWTNSAYLPYNGFKAPEGAIGEYNGKFMINQMVLRGGSCATPVDHIRPTYRNFFHPHLRWMYSGIRLAESI